MNRSGPPSGAAPPAIAQLSDGAAIDLRALAMEVCALYRSEFPDEQERYGEAGMQWCLHDNQYLLAWAIQDARDGTILLTEQSLWLRSVLENRGFPVERLVRNLELAATVVRDSDELGELASSTSRRLAAAAAAASEPAVEP